MMYCSGIIFKEMITHFLNKFSLDNDAILVHRKLGQKLITLEDFDNLYNILYTYIFYTQGYFLKAITLKWNNIFHIRLHAIC